MLFVIRQIVMQITVNQYSVAYDVGLSQLYDNQLNSSLQCSSEHSTTINKTPHEVRLSAEPVQTKSSIIPDKCRLARQLTDETTHPTHPISENSSVNDWSRRLLLRSRQEQSCPTTADEDTLTHPHFLCSFGMSCVPAEQLRTDIVTVLSLTL